MPAACAAATCSNSGGNGLAGQTVPRTEIRRRVNPGGGFGGADPQQLRQQVRGATARVLVRQPAGLDLGDQSVVHRSEPTLLDLQIAQHGEQLLAG